MNNEHPASGKTSGGGPVEPPSQKQEPPGWEDLDPETGLWPSHPAYDLQKRRGKSPAAPEPPPAPPPDEKHPPTDSGPDSEKP